MKRISPQQQKFFLFCATIAWKWVVVYNKTFLDILRLNPAKFGVFTFKHNIVSYLLYGDFKKEQ